MVLVEMEVGTATPSDPVAVAVVEDGVLHGSAAAVADEARGSSGTTEAAAARTWPRLRAQR